jgi:hypothetical protein
VSFEAVPTTDQFIQTKPRLINGFRRAVLKALRLVRHNPAISGPRSRIQGRALVMKRFGGLDEGFVSRDPRAIKEEIETEPRSQRGFMVSGSRDGKY